MPGRTENQPRPNGRVRFSCGRVARVDEVCSASRHESRLPISIKESLSQHVQVDDGVTSTLELLPILQKDRMSALLGAELEGRGFTRNGNTATRKEKNGVEVEVDLETGQVRATPEKATREAGSRRRAHGRGRSAREGRT